jgi:hypothetical protein
LQRPKKGEPEQLLLLEIDLRDEKFHSLGDVLREHGLGGRRHVVPSLVEPDLKTIALLCRQYRDVIFANHVLGFDRHAKRWARRRSFGRERARGQGF